MAFVAALFLHALHYFYSLVILWRSFWKRFCSSPQSLLATPRRIPKHLAIVLVTDPSSSVLETESCLVQSVIDAVGWCRTAGIEKLTVYEEHGKILEFSDIIRDTLVDDSDESSSESEIEYPLTPPPSDYSESRPISPQHDSQFDMHTVTIHVSNKQTERKSRKDSLVRRRNYAVSHTSKRQLTLCIASREASKPAIASIAELLVSRNQRKSRKNAKHPMVHPFTLSVDALDSLLETDHTLSSPDFMIIHPVNPLHYNRTPMELHGYPPWHIRLTEIYHNRLQYPSMTPMQPTRHTSLPLDEATFKQALDDISTTLTECS